MGRGGHAQQYHRARAPPVSQGHEAHLKTLRSRGQTWLAWVDRQVPVAVKLIAPTVPMIAIAATLYLVLSIPPIQRELERAYAASARYVAASVQAEYEARDRVGLNRFVQSLVKVDASVRRIRVYRLVDGSPVLWASSEPSELSTYRPRPHDIEPLTTGQSSQEVETIDGVRVLETASPLRVDGVIDASVGVYLSLEALDAATADILRLVLLGASVVAILVVLALAATLNLVVFRPIGRLHRAAVRVATGDLSVRLPEGELPSVRDEIAKVAREFDRMVRLVAEQHAEVERLAATDGLTGLGNRRSFDDRIRLEVDRALRLNYPLVVSLVDLDGFKKVNDGQGHLAGDDALRRVAIALTNAVRASDVLARYGGDEFAIIQPGCDTVSAAIVGARVRAAVEGLRIVVDPRTGQLLSASVGAAEVRSGGSAVDALAEADAALYRAKVRGGGVEVAVQGAPHLAG